MIEGEIFDIQTYAIHDGPGIRTLVFMKGCPLRCIWCHNPEGRSSGQQIMYTDFKCVDACGNCFDSCPLNALVYNGKLLDIRRDLCTVCDSCAKACPTGAIRKIGKRIQPEEILKEVEKYAQVYDGSGGGVTFSGGDPVFQPEFLRESLILCHSRRIRTAVETSGYTSTEVLESIIPYTDLFLFDIKLSESELSRKYTGMPNGPIKENLKFLVEHGFGPRIILRFPVIPGITDTEENINGWLDFLSGLGKTGITSVHLLPYHDVSEKFNRIGLNYEMVEHSAPDDLTMSTIKNKFESIGMNVKIGG